MKKSLVGLFFVAILVLSLTSVLAAPKPSVPACPITSSTNIVIYGETGLGGVGDISKSWIGKFMAWMKAQDSSVNYVFLDAADVKTDCQLKNYPQVKLYIQPGGNAYYQQKKLDVNGKNNILDYINSRNGSYLGICAGFFYASSDYYWQGTYYNWPNLLMKYPTTEGSITQIADYDQSPGYALTQLSNGFNAIYYGGPTRGLQFTPNTSPGEIKTTFASVPNNMPAIVKNGKMLLTSVHLEAYENDGISGLATNQRIENYKLLGNLINEAAGTNFYVPAYYVPAPVECNDGIDNDYDNLTDYPLDAGCSSLTDTSEIDMPTGQLFSDDFSAGLGAWTITTASGANSWGADLGYASVTPSSTTEPAAVMETTINANGYSTIQINYDRKLVGLDSADEFKALWYDGNTWNTLEQTGTNSADDLVFLAKQFGVTKNPVVSDIKIRFECTAGAVSESCSVDNVVVSGQ